MTNSIQTLLSLYKADNSRQTTDKIAEALELAVKALMIVNCGSNVSPITARETDKQITKEALQQIQTIAEGK